MEDFENKALSSYPLKPKCWYRYVDDTFVIWQHGLDNLNDFLQHLNNIHPNITFTMEIEKQNQLPFLDILVTKTEKEFSYTLFRKPTHTNRYLNAHSHHHPSQLRAIIKSLTTRSIRLTDIKSRNVELNNLTNILKLNGYPLKQIQKIIVSITENRIKPKSKTEELKRNLILPYIKGVTDTIARKFPKTQFRTIFKPHTTIHQLLRNPKDKFMEKNKGYMRFHAAIAKFLCWTNESKT
ncbi:hypothetical protein RI129_011494 [Pyrocoelia pectoralis]|uniref:Helix-turn-helix domain-containing protein n=1 Tax=Pyrocoelia pectoralis TaxID=417401 RepID=A0AAN7ZD00_9COLE